MTAIPTLASRARRHPAEPEATGFDRHLTTPLLFGAMLNPINSSMIAIALIPIGAAFGASPAATAWLVSGLYLATAIGQPLNGRLVDQFGARPLYLIGAGLVGVAGVLGTLAPSLGVLVVARVLLGFGTSAQFPAAMYLIRSEAQRTGRTTPGGILTALSIAAQSTMVIGPTLGGALIELGGWRLLFAVNVPLAAACLALGTQRLPQTKPIRSEHRVSMQGFFRNAPLMATYARQMLTYVLTYSFIYGFAQWLEEGRGLSASTAGLVVLPISLTAIVVAWLSGRRQAIRGKLVIGTISMLAASIALLSVGSKSAIWVLIVVGLLAGTTQGLNGLANQNALFRQADAARMGTASGLLRTFQYLGAMLSSAAIAVVFQHGAKTPGLHNLAIVMICCGAVLLAAVLIDPSLRRIPNAVCQADETAGGEA